MMKTSELLSNKQLYRGKPKGYYDPSPVEVFFIKLGQEIFKFTDNNQHKTQMTDEEWILYCDTANKCTRFGTLYGPKEKSDFTKDELRVIQKFIEDNPGRKWID